MAKFDGVIGFGISSQTAPGVWRDTIVEKQYYGDILRNSLQTSGDDKVNPDLSVNNTISIVADDYLTSYLPAIRFAVMAGVAWVVESVDLNYPRLLLRLGGVYNGSRQT